MDNKQGRNTEVIAEYRLLNALVKHNEYIDNPNISIDTFVNETAKSVYEAILQLHKDNIEITPASLYQAGYNIDFNVNEAIIDRIYNIDDNGATDLKDILNTLGNIHSRNMLVEKLTELRDGLLGSNTVDVDNTLAKLYELDEITLKTGKSNSKLLSYSEWADRYIDDLEKRKIGRKYSFGDPLLDEHIYKGASPGGITIISANTGMGKSTFVLSLIDSLIEQNSPCMYISLEMGTIDTMDRLISKRLDINGSELYKPEGIDDIIEKVNQDRRMLGNRRNFYFCEATGVDIEKLRLLIREFKQKTKQDYCLVAIDLLSGMKGFMGGGSNSGSTASNIEINMNRLEDLAKEENVHIIGVIQFKRESESLKISHVEEIEKLRPSLSDAKNSGAYAEKASTFLSLFRKKAYALRYCKDDPATETLDDILEVQILKDRTAPVGKIFKYMFDGEHFKVYPLVDEEAQKLESLKDLDIDF